MVQYLALHETLDVHELITAKNLALTKAFMMNKLAVDQELKTMLEAEVTAATNHIEQLQQLITERERQQ